MAFLIAIAALPAVALLLAMAVRIEQVIDSDRRPSRQSGQAPGL